MFNSLEEALNDYASRHGVNWQDVAYYVRTQFDAYQDGDYEDEEDFDQDHWDEMISLGAEVLEFHARRRFAKNSLIAWIQTEEQRDICEEALNALKVLNQRELN